jgi:hypothetical protein
MTTPKLPQRSRLQRSRIRYISKSRGTKLLLANAAITILAVISTMLIIFLVSPASLLHTPQPKPIGSPGHIPGRFDVSSMTPAQRFYAVPNFYYDQSCGRPCWLPLYQKATEQSAFVTNGWPCEYYEPNSSVEPPSCLRPPPGRTPSEMANPSVEDSGDRLEVLCQVNQIGRGQPAQTIDNDAGQISKIWDMVAVPASYISTESPAERQLRQVPGMPGFYQAFAPDIWLGNTGWHGIPC